jgi:2,4-dienoyl-CoA reductase-like NADH-dependent reductase (Old Yellow Enzyme family)
MTPFPLLLSPFELRGRALRNRIASTPHATGWGGHAGRLDRSEVDYHVRKAAGGCGLVMTFGSASVDPTTAASYGRSRCGTSATSRRCARSPTACMPTGRAASRR